MYADPLPDWRAHYLSHHAPMSRYLTPEKIDGAVRLGVSTDEVSAPACRPVGCRVLADRFRNVRRNCHGPVIETDVSSMGAGLAFSVFADGCAARYKTLKEFSSFHLARAPFRAIARRSSSLTFRRAVLCAPGLVRYPDDDLDGRRIEGFSVGLHG